MLSAALKFILNEMLHRVYTSTYQASKANFNFLLISFLRGIFLLERALRPGRGTSE